MVGYTSGVFDLFHDGHRIYLSNCMAMCQFLFVGVDCDLIVRNNKGIKRPIHPDFIRRKIVQDFINFNYSFIKNKHFFDLIKQINPDIVFYPHNKIITKQKKKFMKQNNIKLIRLPYTKGVSTSIIIQNYFR